MSSWTLLFFLIPAVSTSTISKPKAVYLVSIESLVVPEISVTMFLSSPKRAFVRDDFPTLGGNSSQTFVPITMNYSLKVNEGIEREEKEKGRYKTKIIQNESV